MSNRTREATTAIREAWRRERELVLEGKGTRDWTLAQQQSILEKGNACDDDGKAFQGHHMKSANAYPDFQGDPSNIQFLTRKEHVDAHGGVFRIPTNGYYDPATRTTKEFPPDSFEPCPVILLSQQRTPSAAVQKTPLRRTAPQKKHIAKKAPPAQKTIRDRLRAFSGKASDFLAEHPKALQALKIALTTQVFKIALDAVANVTESEAASTPSLGGGASVSRPVPSFANKDGADFSPSDETDDETSTLSRNYPLNHKSPKPHTRREHLRHLKSGKVVQVSQASVGKKTSTPNPSAKS